MAIFTTQEIDTIENFIKDHGNDYPRATTFAICNYVGYKSMGLTKYFPNCFCFYPSSQPITQITLDNLKDHDQKIGGLNGSND